MTRRILDRLLHATLVGFGLILVAVGVMLFFSPFPIGVPFAGVGLFLLLTRSRRAQRIIKNLRTNNAWLDQRIVRIEDSSNGRLRSVLASSRPDPANGETG